MDNFNNYWEQEKTRRRKQWTARYKRYLEQHLSAEQIKERTFTLRYNCNTLKDLQSRHASDKNPFISPDDWRLYFEERLRNRLDTLGADTNSLSIKTSAETDSRSQIVVGRYYWSNDYEIEITEIHYGGIIVQIKAFIPTDKRKPYEYVVRPYYLIDRTAQLEYSHTQIGFLDIATLLMEMAADYDLRKEECLYYMKRLRLDKMGGVAIDDISFKLWDDKKLKARLEAYKNNDYSEERMLKEVVRSWMIATNKYITLVTEVNRDEIWRGTNHLSKINLKDFVVLKSSIKKMDRDSLVFITSDKTITIDSQGNTSTFSEHYCNTGNKIIFQPFSDFPELTFMFHEICTKAVVEYVRQAMDFNKNLLEYLKKAKKWYRQLQNKDIEDYSIEIILPQNKIIMGVDNKHITKVNIPDTATYIKEYAFCGLTSLAEITLPENLAYVGNAAFKACEQLHTVHIHSQLTVINPETFCGCHHLKQVEFPSSLLIIGAQAFAGCYRLQQISFPASLLHIGHNAFSHCHLLEKLYFSSYSPEQIEIANDAFGKDIYDNSIVFVPGGMEEAYKNSKSFAKFKHICSIE